MNNVHIVQFLLVLFLILFNSVSASLVGQVNAITYTTRDDLPTNNVISIAEDKNGYLILGTSAGLVYYNGVDFVPFGRDKNGESPGNVFIYEVIVDNDDLWVLTELNGIFHFNAEKNYWTRFSMNSDMKRKLPSDDITAFSLCKSGLYFSCKDCGLSTISSENSTVITNIDNSGSTYRDFISIDSVTLLLGNDGIYKWSGEKRTLYRELDNLTYTDVYLQNDEIFLSSYQSGIYTININNKKHISPSLELDEWRTKIVGRKGSKIYFTYMHLGFASYDLENHSWQLFTPRPFDNNSIPKALYYGGMIDSRGIIWLASSKGLVCIPDFLQRFTKVDNSNGQEDFLLDVIQDEKSGNYIASFASEWNTLKIYNRDLRLINEYDHHPHIDKVKSFFKLAQYKGIIYSMSDALYEIAPNTGKASLTSHRELRNYTKPRYFEIDKDGIFWMVTRDMELLGYDLEKRQMVVNNQMPKINNLEDGYIIHNIEVNSNYVVFATSYAVVIFNKKNQTFKTFELKDRHLASTNSPQKDNKLENMYLLKDTLYVCSRIKGVFGFSLTEVWNNENQKAFCVQDSIYSPTKIEYDNGNFWISTDDGLYLSDQNLKIERKFTVNHGLDKSKLTLGFSIVGNKIFLDGEQGITIGDISKLKSKNPIPHVDISEVRINNQVVNLSTSLLFNYKEKDLQVDVSSPIFGNSMSYEYEYRLQGHHNEWLNSALSNNKFRYDNLKPGDYIFEIRVKSESELGKINTLKFIINPPWWNTWYFILGVLLLSLLAIYYSIKYRANKQLKEEKIKTTLARLENTAIRSQLNPHFIFNSLNSIRSMILLDRKENSIIYVEQFSLLVREILQYSKLELITLHQEIELNRKYLEIEKFRFVESFSFEFHIAEDISPDDILVPPMIIQPFVENAVWHGLLHKDGNAKLQVITTKIESRLKIEIIDNGIGRDKSRSLKNKKSSRTKSKLGIELSRKRIKMLDRKSSIDIVDNYKDNEAIGTSVFIVIPLISKYEKN